MADPEDSLIFDFKNRTATAKGRFTILAVLAFTFAFMAGVTYFGGIQVLNRIGGPETTASIER